MEPSTNDSTRATSSSSSDKPSDIDGQLAGAGYRVRSSDLTHVAHRLEILDSAMVGGHAIDCVSSSSSASLLSSDAVHYNPSDLASWLDSMLSHLNPAPLPDLPYLPPPLHPTPPSPNPISSVVSSCPLQHDDQQEDTAIRLVHMLMTCAETIERGDVGLAGSFIEEMGLLLTRVNTSCGIGKVAGAFIDALSLRLCSPANCLYGGCGGGGEWEILYHHFYEACPYLKFAHFTANQAILEAFDGHDCVHVIDFNLMHGLQWPALIQALALRSGGPPLLRLTGIGPPSPDGRDSLREIGIRLAELARSVGVRFAFRGVAATRLDQVKPWMLQLGPREAVAVNSIMQLHRLLAAGEGALEGVLGWIWRLSPRIVTVVEQEARHNEGGFAERFGEALHYYSRMFDSLETCGAGEAERALAEMYVQREICNVVGCEGAARVERHEPLARWRDRMVRAGFSGVHLGSNAYKQASMLLTLFSSHGYCVDENDGCLTLGWHSRPLIAASAWKAAD